MFAVQINWFHWHLPRAQRPITGHPFLFLIKLAASFFFFFISTGFQRLNPPPRTQVPRHAHFSDENRNRGLMLAWNWTAGGNTGQIRCEAARVSRSCTWRSAFRTVTAQFWLMLTVNTTLSSWSIQLFCFLSPCGCSHPSPDLLSFSCAPSQACYQNQGVSQPHAVQ